MSGLMPDTPLGSVVTIRAEKDPKVIKGFNADQKRIYNDWRKRRAERKLEDQVKLDQEMKALEAAMARMFGGGVDV